MRIDSLETVRSERFPNLCWLRIGTEDGPTGLGETFYGAAAVEAQLHDQVAPRLIGRDPLQVDRIAQDLVGYLGFRSTGVETRASSAVDIALWDLFGRAAGLPVWQLLGGRARERIRTYNTCAGPTYVRSRKGQTTGNWGLDDRPERWDDLNGFLTDAGALAEDLLSEGITAMKIWPFDPYAEASDGLHIAADDLARALQPFEKIRAAVGMRMDVMVEFHSLWRLLPAMRIARALAPFGTFWHEDPIRMDSLADLRRYADASPAPVCASETLGSKAAFRDLLETGAAGVVMLDIAWCGGLTEARKIAYMADAWRLPVAPHDCTGPVTLCASTHLSLHATNALVQESVRAFHRTWYREIVTTECPIVDGHITTPDGPGLGCDLQPGFLAAETTHRRRTTRADL